MFAIAKKEVVILSIEIKHYFFKEQIMNIKYAYSLALLLSLTSGYSCGMDDSKKDERDTERNNIVEQLHKSKNINALADVIINIKNFSSC